jgi:pimeloyl-ACP methyl ester carboxylesterase
MRKIQFLALLLILLVLAGCSREENNSQNLVLDGLEKDVVLDGAFTMVEGDFGTGSMYRLYCPDDWNGSLVLYSHGYAFPNEEPALPTIDDIRDALLEMGYGVAYSSYSQTGWAVHVAINETRQLRGLFSGAFSHPDKTYLIGKSMGSNVAVALAERNPNLFDGVVPMCGVVGGTKMAVDYIFNLRLLFDYYYPGVIPGSAVDVPEGLDAGYAAFVLVYDALVSNPLPAFEMAGIDPLNIQYADVPELFTAIVTGIYFQVGSFNDFLARNHGQNFFDNSDDWYSGSSDDALLNAAIPRYTSTPAAEAVLKQWYEPTGKLKIPAVTIHTTRDEVVQIFQEGRYFEKVSEAGYADNLVQHYIDRFGHCVFSLEEIMAAFNEMVAMGDSQVGSKPRDK